MTLGELGGGGRIGPLAEAQAHRIAALMDELAQALANWQAAAQERDVALSNTEAAEKENRLLRARVQAIEGKL